MARPRTAIQHENFANKPRFTIIRLALEKEITQAQVARIHQISLRTVQRWIKSYREQGLAGLADPARFPLSCFNRWKLALSYPIFPRAERR